MEQDLLNYLMMYRSTSHPTTGKSPSELLFGRNIRDKLPVIDIPIDIEEEVRDRDKEDKEKGNKYADDRRRAKPNQIEIGDQVLVKEFAPANKLASKFNPQSYTVVDRKDSEVVVQSEFDGQQYRRNVAHTQRISDGSDRNAAANADDEVDELTMIAAKRPKRQAAKPARYQA